MLISKIMKIRKLTIRNFRGVRNLEWMPDDDNIISLIGHGDSGKSSILKAIEYVLYPNWNPKIDDTDFYKCDPHANPIEIEIIIGELSSSKLTASGFLSEFTSLWNIEKKMLTGSDEAETSEKTLTIILRVDETLQPFWYVKNESGEDKIKYKKRELFNMRRLDNTSHRNFRWGYNTVLSKITERGVDSSINAILAEAGRSARNSIREDDIASEIKESAKVISEEARLWGAGNNSLKPYLDVFSAEALCLNDSNNVPVYMLGNGSKKLMLIAMEKYLISNEESPQEHVILIDEIENSLDPHRLIHAIFALKEIANNSTSQVIMSTQSTIVLKEIAGNGTYRVNNVEGEVTVVRLSPDHNHAIRSGPEGFFLKKVVVCEGKTEIGVLRTLKKKWIEESSTPPEHFGAYFVLGEGSTMARLAKVYMDAGYEVCVFRDNDDEKVIVPEGVEDFTYSDPISIETAICRDAPEVLIEEIVTYCQNLGINDVPTMTEYNPKYRDILAKYLHDKKIKEGQIEYKGVFRRIDTGEKLGELILPHWSEMESGVFLEVVRNLKSWIYEQ